MHIHPYAVLSILSALISLITSLITWRRSGHSSLALSLLLLSMAVWSMAYATRWLDISIETKAFWFNVMFIGVASLPSLFLWFVVVFTHHEAGIWKRNLKWLAIQPIVLIFLQWTNSYHHLLYSSLKAVQVNEFMAMEYIRGPLYFVSVMYSYTIIGIALFLLSQSTWHLSLLHRNQYRLIILASILPWIGNIYSENYFDALHGLDLAPILFGVSAITFAYSVLHNNMMDLIPIARSHLIENMSDGILVLDAQNRIVDINPAMEDLVENRAASYVGKSASDVFQPWTETLDILLDGMETHAEIRSPRDPSRHLDLRVTRLYDRNQVQNGCLIIFHDITERKQVEKRLRYVNDRLQNQLIEIGLLQSKLRDQAIRDPLTQLFNRRYLEETLDHELARASREDYPVCIIMLDLDHFKQINDTYGHEAGDQVLKAVAFLLSEECRRGDFVCRYGGEEFVVVMPNIELDTAYERAESIKESLSLLEIPYKCFNLTITISVGIACHPRHGSTRYTILHAADQAMYGAKEAGRDHILSYDELQVAQQALDD